ncbi:MAG: zinc-ribbon domain-containing protein [Anaerolineales bacterium]|nr:zinc-ribbon domain-containing protein [Anaerolineales bacterium]
MSQNDGSPLKGFRPLGGEKQESSGAKERESRRATVTPTAAEPRAAATAFCPNCGEKLKRSANFCPECGAHLAETPAARPAQRSRDQYADNEPAVQHPPLVSAQAASDFWGSLTRGFKASTSGALGVLICFFLPWVTVACGQSSLSLNGADLASGFSFMGQPVEGGPALWLVLLAALGAIYLAYRFFSGDNSEQVKVLGPVGLGLVGLLAMYSRYDFFQELVGSRDAGFTVNFELGLWGTLLGLIAIVAGGALNKLE